MMHPVRIRRDPSNHECKIENSQNIGFLASVITSSVLINLTILARKIVKSGNNKDIHFGFGFAGNNNWRSAQRGRARGAGSREGT